MGQYAVMGLGVGDQDSTAFAESCLADDGVGALADALEGGEEEGQEEGEDADDDEEFDEAESLGIDD